MRSKRPLPRNVATALRSRGATLEDPVPPSWFCTTSTVCSASPVAGLLHPAADRGFAAFHASRSRSKTEIMEVGVGGSPRDEFRTPRRIPLDRSRTVSPQPLPSFRYGTREPSSVPRLLPDEGRAKESDVTLGCRALLRNRIRSVGRPLPVGRRPILPWAWFPFRVILLSIAPEPSTESPFANRRERNNSALHPSHSRSWAKAPRVGILRRGRDRPGQDPSKRSQTDDKSSTERSPEQASRNHKGHWAFRVYPESKGR